MFDAMLKKDNDPLSAAEIVEFPIPEAQYEETIRALNGIQSGAVVEQDCFVADIGTADCPALERLIGTMANVDELDWLGKQLESFADMNCCNLMQRWSDSDYCQTTSSANSSAG